MGTVFLRRLSRWQAESEREGIGDLYAAAHRDAPGARPLERAEFVRRFTDHDIQQPDFDLVLAGDPGPVGCAWGFRADRGSRWWQSFLDVPAEIDELTQSRQVFVLAGVVVLPQRRRGQLGTRLHRELLSRSRAPLSLALVEPGNAAALAALQSWGWSKAGQLTPADGSPPLETWARR
ncbi:GNAT family N-acetyltransferase [Streptomyces hoynatensis]|nr:GNAT family N-acetyltransferase [Streptomyces hoynatensis]